MAKVKKDDEPIYLRIGTDYYKIIDVPLASKDFVRKIINWQKTTIDEDHGKPFRLNNIMKFDSFCLIPDHVNYKREVNRTYDKDGNVLINGSYNQYEPITWEPKEGNHDKTLLFLKHIFDDQIQVGIDYLTIIYRYPTQILPILCLVSIERSTGKTTFLNWLKLIYQANMTVNTNEDFRNQFNSGWASKLIIGVDEVLLDRKEDSEKIKNLSTTRTIKSEAKGRDKTEQEFYGKFILCSNNETDFIKIPPDEIRFWIRKVPTINIENIDLLSDLKNEIPAFLYFLKTRDIVSEKKTRMWFSSQELFTDALRNVIIKGASKLEQEIRSLIIDHLLNYKLEEVQFTPKDIIELLRTENNFRAEKTDIINVIKTRWNYSPEIETKHYNLYSLSNNGEEIYSVYKQSAKGRFYTFKRTDFIK